MTHGDIILLTHPDTRKHCPEAEQTEVTIARILASLEANGQTAEVTEVVIAGTKLVQLTVVGKRQGEGQIAADMKARKA